VIKKIILFIILTVTAFFFITKYSDHNLKKAISSCIIAQTRTSDTPDIEKAQKFCEEKIKKQRKIK
tara:strand:+ start:225 stop:422 length:198 start_codon:yes stop_codon:yes gene_type:complete